MKQNNPQTNEFEEELDKQLDAEHCGSCHSEWEDGYGSGEEPCCSRAISNIRDAIFKAHQRAVNEAVLRELERLLEPSDAISEVVAVPRGVIEARIAKLSKREGEDGE